MYRVILHEIENFHIQDSIPKSMLHHTNGYHTRSTFNQGILKLTKKLISLWGILGYLYASEGFIFH